MTIAVSIDGTLVAPEAATISVFDRGLLYGDGLFEVLRTWDGRAPDLDAHLDRLCASAQILQLRVDRAALARAVHLTVAAAGAGDHRVRVVVTRGPGALAARLAELGLGRTIVVVEPLPPQPRELSVAVVDWPLPRRAGHKTLAYLDHVIARELAAAAGADEALRLDADGNIAECATANLFVVAGRAVATPPLASGALPGVTRARVIALGDATERALPLADLHAADELFATSALRGVVPITKLDGEAKPVGAVTRRIAAAYAQAMRALL